MIHSNHNKLTIVLFEPRIPQNTGNIGRTCAAFNIPLVLIEPLGFSLNDKYMKRAGLDYWPYIDLSIYPNLENFKGTLNPNSRLIGCSKTKNVDLQSFNFKNGDVLLLGREDTGLPNEVKEGCNHMIHIPMPGGVQSDIDNGVRSLNLSTACGIIAYKAMSDLRLLSNYQN